jgi:hypothetical protein
VERYEDRDGDGGEDGNKDGDNDVSEMGKVMDKNTPVRDLDGNGT